MDESLYDVVSTALPRCIKLVFSGSLSDVLSTSQCKRHATEGRFNGHCFQLPIPIVGVARNEVELSV